MSLIRRSLLLSFAQRYSVLLIRMVSLATLSRLLEPHDFGIQASLLAIFMIVTIVAEMGVATYIVKEHDLTTEQFRTAAGVSLTWATVSTAALAAAATWMPTALLSREIAAGLLVLAPIVVLHGFTTPILAMLERRFLFGTSFVFGVTSTLLNFVTAVILALLGFGFMSLVWATAAEYSVRFLLAMYYAPRLGWSLSRLAGWREVVRFGVDMTAVNGLLTLWRSIPNLIVGAMLGFEALGLFARSQNLTLLFKRATIDAAQPVLQPMLMKAGRNGAQLEAIYVRKVTFLSALAWPFFTFLLLMAEPAIILILGRQWSNAVPATQILCLIGFTVPFNSLLSRFHIAEGLIRRYLYGQVIVLVTATALVAGASFVSVEMVCAALVAESLLRSILSHYLLHSTGRYRFSLLAPTLRSSGILTAVSALPPLAAQAADAAATYGTLPTFFVVAAASAVLWFGTARLLRHDLADEVIRLASRAWTVIFNRRLHSVE